MPALAICREWLPALARAAAVFRGSQLEDMRHERLASFTCCRTWLSVLVLCLEVLGHDVGVVRCWTRRGPTATSTLARRQDRQLSVACCLECLAILAPCCEWLAVLAKCRVRLLALARASAACWIGTILSRAAGVGAHVLIGADCDLRCNRCHGQLTALSCDVARHRAAYHLAPRPVEYCLAHTTSDWAKRSSHQQCE